jgi:hypothetical protein
MMQSELRMQGQVRARIIRARPPLGYTLRNRLRPGFLFGWLAYHTARSYSALTGVPTFTSCLKAVLRQANGQVVPLGVLSYRCLTDVGVAYLVDAWKNADSTLGSMKYHASGTRTDDEAAGDTALGTEATTITDRATGTQTDPSANILQSVGTQSYTGSGAITEHGLLSSGTEGEGTLWDRSKFAALNVASGDSIQWTYQLTVNSGG